MKEDENVRIPIVSTASPLIETDQDDEEGGHEGDESWRFGNIAKVMFLSLCLEKGDLKSSKVRGSFLGVVSFGWGRGGKGGGEENLTRGSIL